MQITARSLMSSPVRTLLPTASITEARDSLLRYGHTGLCVVNKANTLVGIISRRDIDVALRHGLGQNSVENSMSVQIHSISPTTPLGEIHALMMTYDVGRLPVVNDGELVGIVTRTDLLRSLYQTQQPTTESISPNPPDAKALFQTLQNRISEIWPALMLIADTAQKRGWALYVVGGAVRDLLLGLVPDATGKPQPLTDIDLVVEGADEGAGVALAEALQEKYPQVSIQTYGQFQTASLTWPSTAKSPTDNSDPLLVDIATARTEFYPYPAANPEVETSSIRQDLYRRDFAMNAMAIKLNEAWDSSPAGSLLDFFGGWIDLQRRHVRVLHTNSFIEDPSRIFRAIRFAVRLGFTIEPQTERFIRIALDSGIYAQMQASQNKTPALQTRLKTELKYILQSQQWEASLQQIERLGALICLHRDLKMTPTLWQQLRRMERWLTKLGAYSHRVTLETTPPEWLIRLELILAQLPAKAAMLAATNLDLSTQSHHRLKNLRTWETYLLKRLSKETSPSQIYSLLKDFKQYELLLMCDRHPRTIGPQIWQYIVHLSKMSPLINGATLKHLGLTPGPQFKEILSNVHQLTLDGKLTTPQSAEAYVRANYF